MEFIPFGAADKIKLSISIVKNIVAVPTKSGKTCTDRDALKFMMLCQAQRLNPFVQDAYLVGYDGKNGPVFTLITAHQSILKRAETCPDYEGMDSGVILVDEAGNVTEREGDFCLPSENVVGGWAKVYRKGRRPMYRRLSIAAMRPNYETPFWSEEKAPGQIVKCAEADALRSTFPTLIGGLYTQGEIIDLGHAVDAKPQRQIFEAPKLVDVIAPASESHEQAEPRKESAPTDPQAGSEVKSTPQDELADFVCRECQASFDVFQKYGMDGAFPEVESMASFADVPAKDASRLLRAKTGLRAGLEKFKI